MRSWLNSTARAGNVRWLDGCPPTKDKVWNGYNAYAGEKGFLAEDNFTVSERNAIKSVKQKSLLNGIDVPKLKEGGTTTHTYISNILTVKDYDTDYYHMVEDKMFLLDVKQLNKVYQNTIILGTYYWIGKPTQKSIDNSEYKSTKTDFETIELLFGYNWNNWNRSPYTTSSYSSDVHCAYRYGQVSYTQAYKGDLGVRPAFYINMSSAIFKSGDGTIITPYIMNGTLNETLATNVEIGDYVQMGKYYDEPILWRCVDIDENGPLMLSDKILTIKPFDATGKHTYLDGTAQADNSDGNRTRYGSNLWQTSSMRSWLNSTASSGNVRWLDGCPPTKDKVYNGYNAYAGEKGFLAEGNFTVSEKNVIKSVKQKSLLNVIDVPKLKEGGTTAHRFDSNIATVVQDYDNAYYQMVEDKIFLLDLKQLNKVYQNGTTLGTDYWIGKLTQKSIDNSEYKYSGLVAESNWHSWNRSICANSDNPYHIRYAYIYGSVLDYFAYNSNIGTRPAFYIDLSSEISKSGNGSIGTPYIMDGIREDINSDRVVDSNDLDLLSKEINTKSTDITWNTSHDFNGDNIIDIYDLVSVAKKIGIN